ncbi:MAG TPA: hypothetical protein VLA89_02380, partial [Gemmatimonadales bacterium]|nr:hypothetical protein [Gemmatimonadales bacterium]
MCHRFPRLKFVSEESGVGWVPFLLEPMDWQWLNSGCREEQPEMDLPASLSRAGPVVPEGEVLTSQPPPERANRR